MPDYSGNLSLAESASNSHIAGNIDAIASLSERELRGWWWAVVVEKIRSEHRGERAALIDRARVLRIELPTGGRWQSLGEIAERMAGRAVR